MSNRPVGNTEYHRLIGEKPEYPIFVDVVLCNQFGDNTVDNWQYKCVAAIEETRYDYETGDTIAKMTLLEMSEKRNAEDDNVIGGIVNARLTNEDSHTLIMGAADPARQSEFKGRRKGFKKRLCLSCTAFKSGF